MRSYEQRLSNAKLSYFLVLIPLIFFALPMGFGNSQTQPLALLLLMPFVFYARKSFPVIAIYFLCIAANSAYNALSDPLREYSIYQFFRSGIPFLFFCSILVGYRDLSVRVSEIFRRFDNSKLDYVNLAITIFVLGQLVQVIFFRYGISLANSASNSGSRVLLFPMTGTILIFFYACYDRRMLLLAFSTIVLLATGSKAVIVAMIVMAALAFFARISLRSIVSYLVGASLILGLTLYANPLAMDRLSSFLGDERGVDITRTYEIYHAKATFYSGVDTILFGRGLASPVTPGIRTTDPRWRENSQYDIENAYWGVLSKLGLVGSGIFLWMFWGLPRNIVSIAVVLILVIFSFKTSYQFFTTFDGSYLLIWSVVLNHLLLVRDSRRDASNSKKRIGRNLEDDSYISGVV